MSRKELSFVIFIIHNLARAWNVYPKKVYEILTDTKILDEYIIPCYDILHTQGKEYLVEDITELVKERGVMLC